jgi:CheY-like chemotaxis protein
MARPAKDTSIHLLKPGMVVLVDGNIDERTATKKILVDSGLEVEAFESANSAVRYMQAQAWTWYPWLVITELVIPGMGGFQLMRRVRELYSNKDIPMIVLTHLRSPEDMIEADLAGASSYLVKPYTKDKLFEIIKKVTTKKKETIEITTHHKSI